MTLGIILLTFGAAVAVWVLNVEEKFGLIPLGYGALAAAIPVGLVLGGFVAEYVAGLLAQAPPSSLACSSRSPRTWSSP